MAGSTDEAGFVVMERYGGPEVLGWRRLKLPSLRPAEVRLRTIASAVNRADLEIRSGSWPVQKEHPFPYVPGLETLGTVVEVGEGVSTLQRGDRVITMMQRLGGIHGERFGGYGESVTVPAASCARLPHEVEPHAVAALGLAAVTALEGLRRLELRAGDRVAVHGAAGGVGSAAVALAARGGADVLAVVSRPEQVSYARSFGAAEVLVVGESTLVDGVGPRTLDAVLETLGARTFRDSVAALRRGGRLCLVGALTGPDLELVAWDLMQDLHLTGYSSENLTGDDLRRDVGDLADALLAGDLRPPEHQVLPLPAAAEAHRRFETGAVRGRILLVPEEQPTQS
jgi:NADPH:quinone reductase